MVEQNAKKGLEFADVGYVLVAGTVAKAGTGARCLTTPRRAGSSSATVRLEQRAARRSGR